MNTTTIDAVTEIATTRYGRFAVSINRDDHHGASVVSLSGVPEPEEVWPDQFPNGAPPVSSRAIDYSIEDFARRAGVEVTVETLDDLVARYRAQVEIDLAWRAYNAAELRIRQEIVDDYLNVVHRTTGMALDAIWDRNAGCDTCPCSPGFVLRRHAGAWISLYRPKEATAS